MRAHRRAAIMSASFERGAERVMRALSGEQGLADVVAELEQLQHARRVADAACEALDAGASMATVREACEAGIRRWETLDPSDVER